MADGYGLSSKVRYMFPPYSMDNSGTDQEVPNNGETRFEEQKGQNAKPIISFQQSGSPPPPHEESHEVAW